MMVVMWWLKDYLNLCMYLDYPLLMTSPFITPATEI